MEPHRAAPIDSCVRTTTKLKVGFAFASVLLVACMATAVTANADENGDQVRKAPPTRAKLHPEVGTSGGGERVTIEGLPPVDRPVQPSVRFGKIEVKDIAHVDSSKGTITLNTPQRPSPGAEPELVTVEVLNWGDEPPIEAPFVYHTPPNDRGWVTTFGAVAGLGLIVIPMLAALWVRNAVRAVVDELRRDLHGLRREGAGTSTGVTTEQLDKTVKDAMADALARSAQQPPHWWSAEAERLRKALLHEWDAKPRDPEPGGSASDFAAEAEALRLEPSVPVRSARALGKPGRPPHSDALVTLWNERGGQDFAASMPESCPARTTGGFVIVQLSAGAHGTLVFPSVRYDTDSVTFRKLFHIEGTGARLVVACPAKLNGARFGIATVLEDVPAFEVTKGKVRLE